MCIKLRLYELPESVIYMISAAGLAKKYRKLQGLEFTFNFGIGELFRFIADYSVFGVKTEKLVDNNVQLFIYGLFYFFLIFCTFCVFHTFCVIFQFCYNYLLINCGSFSTNNMLNNIDVIDAQINQQEANEFRTLLAQQNAGKTKHWDFEVIAGQFKQSNKSTDDTTFNYLQENFGIETSWKEIVEELTRLNKSGGSNVVYKVFFLARHGQGYHNLAHEKYGNDAWNEYWSKLTGDGEIVWGPDPELTQLGIDQATRNNQEWKVQLDQGAPKPTKFYSSPLSRSIDTLIKTWEDIVQLSNIKPLIKENIRETTGVHTCDKRSTKSKLSEKYSPLGFLFEPGFEEEDIYYKDDVRESVSHHALRVNESFQQIFDENEHENQVIGITSHSGTIRASLLALGHREFAVGTGGMIPVFVKGERK